MKKFLIILITLAAVVSVNAQDGASLTPSKKLTVAESRQGAAKEPTYQGGKPYSQWVAEEKAKQLATLNITSNTKNSNTGLLDLPKQPTTAPATKQPDDEATTKLIASKEVTKPTKEAVKEAVKETLPAALKGTSMDPEARPIMPTAKATDVVVPTQNSGNTQPPVTEDKKVTKEDNTVPSSIKPAKKD